MREREWVGGSEGEGMGGREGGRGRGGGRAVRQEGAESEGERWMGNKDIMRDIWEGDIEIISWMNTARGEASDPLDSPCQERTQGNALSQGSIPSYSARFRCLL